MLLNPHQARQAPPAASWPGWVDDYRWEPTDADEPPAPADEAQAFEPTDEDWQEWCSFLDRRDASQADETDVDIDRRGAESLTLSNLEAGWLLPADLSDRLATMGHADR